MSEYIPYGRHHIDEDDIAEVIRVLNSDWLTTGPKVEEFEEALADFCNMPHAVAVNSGTAALHLVMACLDIGPGDEVIVPAMTFVATANAVVYLGATPVFADVQEDTLLVDPASIEKLITPKTKAIVAVDYAGQPCDYDVLSSMAQRYGVTLISDACHSLGGAYKGRPVGSLADITVFSFHPVKPITTGEGGAIVFKDKEMAQRARRLRNHGIDLDFKERASRISWEYDMVELGFNYRISDIQCALGLTQLKKLPKWIEKRNEIANAYRKFLAKVNGLCPLSKSSCVKHSYHLFVIKITEGKKRKILYERMRKNGIGVNVHYKPVYLNTFYKKELGFASGLCPVSEMAYDKIISLPLYPSMTVLEVKRVVDTIMIVIE